MAGEQQPVQQPGDRMTMDDHASAIDRELAKFYNDDFTPRDAEDKVGDDSPEERDETRSDDDSPRRKRREREEARDEEDDDARAEDDDDDAEGQAEEQPEEHDDDDLEDDADGDEDDEAAGDEIKTIADLAEALDKAPEDVMEGLTLTLDNGDEVSLAELRAGHMRDRDYRQKTEEVATQRRAVADQEAKLSEKAQDAITVNTQLLDVMRQALVRNLDSPEMQKLRAERPADYLLAREEAQSKIGALQQAQQRAAEHLNKLKQQQQERSRQELEQYVSEQREQLEGTLGGLTPERKRAIKDFVVENLGFEPEEFGTVLDHRFIVGWSRWMDDRRELENLRGQGAEKREKAEQGTRRGRLRKRGRRGGKGRGARQETRSQADHRRAIAKARETGGVKEAAAAIKNLI